MVPLIVLALVACGIAVIVVVIVLLVRRNQAPQAVTKITSDGFFIVGTFHEGAVIKYEVRTQTSGWMPGSATAVGVRTFVYTGSTPTGVRITSISEAGAVLVGESPPSSGPASSNSEVFGGFPSAY